MAVEDLYRKKLKLLDQLSKSMYPTFSIFEIKTVPQKQVLVSLSTPQTFKVGIYIYTYILQEKTFSLSFIKKNCISIQNSQTSI